MSVNPTPERNNLITPNGYKNLVAEHTKLSQERPKIVDEVSQAARQGDRSENAEYIYGKRRLREIDGRMRFLYSRIETSRVINPSEQSGKQILFGATVKLQNDFGKIEEFQIIGEDEVNVAKGKISYKSPVGSALLKHGVGDTIEVEAPRGTVCYTIISFEYK